jgi:aminoglycoside phosphotransferase family enzyme
MHGIVRVKNFKQNSGETSQVHVEHVVVRYSDGRTLTFLPEAGREKFSEDDMMEVAKVLARASSTSEWAEAGDASGPGG